MVETIASLISTGTELKVYRGDMATDEQTDLTIKVSSSSKDYHMIVSSHSSILSKDIDTIKSISTEYCISYEWKTVPNTDTIKKAALPYTQDVENYDLIFAMEKKIDATKKVLKVALYNKSRKGIALMTTYNFNDSALGTGSSRPGLVSHDPHWYVGWYRMSAPLEFWHQLKTRTISSY